MADNSCFDLSSDGLVGLIPCMMCHISMCIERGSVNFRFKGVESGYEIVYQKQLNARICIGWVKDQSISILIKPHSPLVLRQSTGAAYIESRVWTLVARYGVVVAGHQRGPCVYLEKKEGPK